MAFRFGFLWHFIFVFCGILFWLFVAAEKTHWSNNYHFVKLYIGASRIAYFCPKRILVANTRVLRRMNGVSDWYCVLYRICDLQNEGILRLKNGLSGVKAVLWKSYLPVEYGNAPYFFSNAPYIFWNASHIHTNCEPHLKKCKAHFGIFHTELQQRSAKTGQWKYECEL